MTKTVAFPKDPSEPKTVGVRHGVGTVEYHFRAASVNIFCAKQNLCNRRRKFRVTERHMSVCSIGG